LNPKEIRDFLEVDKIEGRHWSIFPCSAMTGEGLLEGIDWVVSDIKSRIFMME
jgi:ADP-ribosylation factor-like protein 2